MMKDKFIQGVTAVIFLGLILGLGVIDLALGDKVYSEHERRFLEQRPDLTAEAVFDGSFGESYERYLSDQFLLRDRWVRVKTMVDRGAGKTEVNGVFFGRDGYLLEHFNNHIPEQEQLQKNMAYLAGFIARYSSGAKLEQVKIMLVPGAAQVLTDKLPAFAETYPQNQISLALQQELEERGAGDSYIDVYSLLAAHQQEEIYYRTDHHWTTYGAYLAYCGWADATGRAPVRPAASQWQTVAEDFYGTVSAKVNADILPDAISIFLNDENVQVEYNLGESTADSLYDLDALSGRDKYGVFLGGDYAQLIIKGMGEQEPGEASKILVIKDSYANSLVPFMTEHYQEIHLLDLRYYHGDIHRYIKEHNITDILILYGVMGAAEDTGLYQLGAENTLDETE